MFSTLNDDQWASFLDFLTLRVKIMLLASIIVGWDKVKSRIIPEIDNVYFCFGLAHFHSSTLNHKSHLLNDLCKDWDNIFPRDIDGVPLEPNYDLIKREWLDGVPQLKMPFAWWHRDDNSDDRFSPQFAFQLWQQFLSCNPVYIPAIPLLSPPCELRKAWKECVDDLAVLRDMDWDRAWHMVYLALPWVREMEGDIEAPVLYPIIDLVNHTSRPFDPETFSYDQEPVVTLPT
ncbi:hypothetical protein BKA70DRAFT_1427275 [Coprinopsis sp. MPI-PUGE-AT-0042]|nr:hypothetical protein BKA70DRAFT_1427275 [Coprinopsis sp. MPI-PUGE-AT-0042]